MDDLERTRQEFTHQAAGFAASAVATDRTSTQRILDALGAGGRTGAPAMCGADIRVLDVACGPGIMTVELAGIAREVVAFDLTPEMLIRARERCAEAGFPNVLFEEGSASDMPFPDACFDVVLTRLSIHHFREPCRVLDEMRRVSKKGGTIIIADLVSSEFPEKSALQNAIEVLRDPSHVRMYAASELASLVAGAGLRIEKDETWDTAREFEEWAGIVALPERIDPLRIIVRALARAGEDAGIGLSLAGDTIAFLHRWRMIVARKP
jgi:ubiquinone/menaquinone biosynthesis C-methylase UbiE